MSQAFPELLAPAGSPEALTAAVQAGADAVYLGCGALNARRNAKNFAPEDLAGVVSYCHLRGTKVYLTLNTLLKSRELPQAAETAALACQAGVDAILVQDLGLARLLRETVPDVPLHASTQMTVHNLDGVKACADLGLTRVVLARELSRQALEFLCTHSPIELEVFVHGALCMCYSGQCQLSAVLGGRSGNRGLCAQPCRLSFRFPGDKKPGHPLSLKDLSLAGQLQALSDLGIACLKIEGRMKRPEYVSIVTGIYAAALREHREPTPQELRQLEAAFSRNGFTQGYYTGEKGPAMFGMRPENAKEPTDLFDAARQHYLRGEHKLTPVQFSLRAVPEEPLTLSARDADGHTVTVSGPIPEPARTKPATPEAALAQLSKTGGTVYCVPSDIPPSSGIQASQLQIAEGLSLPASVLNALRREALSALDAVRTAVPPRRVLPFVPPQKTPGPKAPPAWSLSFRRWEQVSPAILAKKPALVYLPPEVFSQHAQEAAALIAAHPETRFGLTLPRVSWDTEQPALQTILEAARSAGVTQALLGHIGQLSLAKAFALVPRADFGLGLLNDLTAQELARLGFVSATLSFEGKLAQLRDLHKPLETELLVYGRLPLMLTEHCLLKNRGKGCSCEKTPLNLQDRRDEAFPVEPAWGCRNELFNSKVLWLADKKSDWHALGLTYARLSFLRETAEDCLAILEAYEAAKAAAGEFTRGLYYRGVE